MISKGMAFLVMLVSTVFLTGCIAHDRANFTEPAQREILQAEKPWPTNGFVVIAYHDVEDKETDQRFMSVRTSALREQFAWLRENGYQPVSIAQIREAHQGGKRLPEKAVLLSFDDGYSSFYTRVFPLLKAYQWPALWAPVGSWINTPADQKVQFGDEKIARERFANWEQIRELSRSPLVEIGAHTWNSHFGISSNPAGSRLPAFANRYYDQAKQRYETEQEYRQRIREDAEKVTREIKEHSGKAPTVWVWPYGAANGIAIDELKKQGYDMFFTLNSGLASATEMDAIPRILINNNPSLEEFALLVTGVQEPETQRVMHIDLDYVYDTDPQQMERNLDLLVQRVKDMSISTVYLQAFADSKGDGLVREVYFQNRWLPVKADIFGRIAWQLRTRASVQVYAWMPVLSWDLAPSLTRVQKLDLNNSTTGVDASQYVRLSPYDPIAMLQVLDLYEDLASHADFDGILFHDDALLSDFEDASPAALMAYGNAGLSTNIQYIKNDPQLFEKWTRFKRKTLIDLTLVLSDKVKKVRGPHIKTARNIYALPVLQPESETWFAQNFEDFLQNYDWTAVMAMPYMEGVKPKAADEKWLVNLIQQVKKVTGATDKTIFELQSMNWKKDGQHLSINSVKLAQWMSLLQRNGVKHYGYYPDDFVKNSPDMNTIRPEFSLAWYPEND
ncbi:poly-beta-1,6-N-acetyl-D-glucosamine N-deacetylase PgaB [Citrobacter tructae]|uniref:poly-beta-1,6-N-acetyl-D-glucosamine N-deacetylase PgaB n=1 Tax=Citrobacter tructae TaxID=2562449 RepID=UPI003F57B00F